MRRIVYGIGFFKKYRNAIASRNYISEMAGCVLFLVASLIAFLFDPKDHATVGLVLFVAFAVFITVIVRVFYVKHPWVVDLGIFLWYFLGFSLMVNVRYRFGFKSLVLPYLIITMILALLFFVRPATFILAQLCGAAIYIGISVYVKDGVIDKFEAARVVAACFLAIIVGLVRAFIGFENLVFSEEMLKFTDDNPGGFAAENDDVYWEGRNKYGILSGHYSGTRRVFSVVFSVTKRRIERVRDNNAFGLYEDMSWNEAKSKLVNMAISPQYRNTLEKFFNMEVIEHETLSGRRRFTAMAGFCLESGEKIWFDIECVVKIHPVSGELIGTLLFEDITEERILMGVLNKLVEKNSDADFCFEVKSAFSLYLTRDERREIKMEPGPSYDVICREYAENNVAKYDKEAYLAASEINTVVSRLEKEGVYELQVDEISESGRILKKRFQYSFMDPSHMFINVIKQDITEVLAREEQAKAKLESALIAKNRAMNAQKEFLTRVSHEIRTPMNAILGLSSLMESDYNKPAKLKEYIAKIRYSGQFLLSLVNDVLDMSKMEQHKFTVQKETVSFGDFTSAVETMIVPMCQRKGLSYKSYFDIAPDASAKTDKMRLMQVFVNLLSNAVKYTPAGGHVSFSARVKERNATDVTVEFKVEDDGIGMSESFQHRVFEPFTQESRIVDPELSGTGLGLAITKGIVETFGGTISVKSKQGQGSTFVVTIPFERTTASITTVGVETSDLNGLRALVVEDNEINSDIAVAVLEKKGMIATTAENGKIALDKFKEAPEGHFDFILMDIRMPVMDGIHATRLIRGLDRKDSKTVPIIAMTANVLDGNVENVDGASFDALLTKPVDPAVLYSCVAAHVIRKNN